MNTNQYSELDRIKLKIKALAAKTVDNGASEAEAVAAMNVVGRLLTQYNLTMNELDVRDASYRTLLMPIDRAQRHPIDHCVTTIAAFVGAKCWFDKRRTGSSYAFFGQEQDLELAKYLFDVIMAAMAAEGADYKRTDYYRGLPNAGFKRAAYVNFQRGMASRLAQRLQIMKREHDARYKNTGNALVVLKDQLTNDAFKKQGPKLVRTRTKFYVTNPFAYSAGQEAGNNVNLSRPIDPSADPKGLLK